MLQMTTKEVENLTIRVWMTFIIGRYGKAIRPSQRKFGGKVEICRIKIQDSMLHWETSEVVEFEQPALKTPSFPRLPMVASFCAAIIAICRFGF